MTLNSENALHNAMHQCTRNIDTGFVALGYTKVAILGAVQGITELLPVSSTAHMRIIPALLGWRDPGSAFSAAMQLAALAAVISYFWSDVRDVAAGAVSALVRCDFSDGSLHFAAGILLATIPIGIAGLLLSPILNACNTPLRGIMVIGFSCLVMGLLLALSEVVCRHKRTIKEMTLIDAILVGIAQIGALIPGVSRSGSTLTAAMFLNFEREQAARLSFMLGLPAIALAGFKELWTLHRAGLDLHSWLVLGTGLLVASISSFFAIWGLQHILKKFSAWPFVIYRLLLGAVLIIGVHLHVLN
jgi:undecaprenyl-diphosphatase